MLRCRQSTSGGAFSPASANRCERTRSDRGDQIRVGEPGKREEKSMGIRSIGSRVLLLVALAGFLVQAGTAAAKSTYLTSFRTTYPTAVGSRIDSCLVCHTTTNASPSTRNVYGTAYGNANHSFTAIDAADTDGDGSTNQVEITQFFFPGNAADHPVAGTLPTVTIAATDATATEAGATTGQYTLTRTGATTAALTVNYTVAGTATAGSDYTVLSGSVQIPAGAATATVTVTPIDDAAVETDETVVVTLSANAAYAVGAAASATVTIQSDDALPTVTIAATDPIATEAGPTTGQYTLTRTGATTAALTVTYTVAGTAAAGSDYTALPGSVQIPAGAATATVTVTPIDDTAVEADETVAVTLGANAAYTVGAAASATVTIQSDDVLPTVTIAATDPTATEAGPTTGQYTLTRTGATTAALTVNYLVAGTATAGSDYAALTGSVLISAGSATATVTVSPIDDVVVETDETVVATLSASAAYTVGAAAGATVTIQSDDVVLPTVTIAATDPIATEAGPTTGQFTLTRTGVTTAALTVNYSVAGTATAGSDYSALTGTLALPAGSATATVTVTPIDDLLVEADETVVVTLSANAAYTVGTTASATVTITSDEATTLPTVTIVAADTTATEAGLTTGQFALTRTGATTAALTVNFTVGGTATAGSDYAALSGSVQIPSGAAAATVTVTPIDDLQVEADETVVATLSANAAYLVGPAASATVTIQSDDVPTVTIAATDAIATEAGPTTGQFTLTRTGATTAALTVNYTAGGAATAGSDYVALSGSVQIAAGAATATVTVTPIDDLLVEADETVLATLSANAAYTVGAAASATVAIQSDDVAPPTVTIAATDATATEAGATTGQFTLTRTGATTAALTVFYTVAGTATAGSDYVALAGSVQVPAGAATATVTVTPIDDVVVEPAETVVATLSANAAYTVGAATGATVTIQSNDVAPSMTLTVASTNPPSGMSISVSPNDQNNAGDGLTQFTRTYAQGVQVTLTASSTFGGAGFSDWSGCTSVSGSACLVTMDVSKTVTANYAASSAYVLWARTDTGQAAVWKAEAGVGTAGVISIASGKYLLSTSGVGAPWEASSYQQVSATEGYVLWTRGDTGQAGLWKVDPSSTADTIPITNSAYLASASGIGGGWQATTYQHVSATEGYVLWTRSDTGHAALWKVNPSLMPDIIPVVSGAYLYSDSGVGGPWQATSYQHVSATEGYVLWTRSDTGQAALWKIDPGAVGTIIPVTAYLYSSPKIGGPWQATSYQHVSATEGYVLWTRSDTGQAALWKIDPSAGASSGGTPPLDGAYLSAPSGIGGPWRATSYILSGANQAVAADTAVSADVQAGVAVLKSGSGAGTVQFFGAICGPGCEEVALPYAARKQVLATAAAGSWFAGWETADGVAIDILQAQPGETVRAVFEVH
jgi:hypothetical protein